MSGPVTSILVRKLGGWNLITVDQWVRMNPAKRDKLIVNESVQFFAGDLAVDAEAAQQALGLVEFETAENEASSEAAASHELADQDDGIQELPMLSTINVVYTRHLRDGVQWIVDRNNWVSPSQELSIVRQRPAPEIYDLRSWQGATILSADLIADSLGIAEDALESVNHDAVDYFRTKFVQPFLGDGQWEVSALQIRAALRMNPHIRLANAS